MTIKKQNIIILGAGIIGVTIAYRLARSGYEVTLIDRDKPGKGASFGNAGIFATEHVFPLANPGILANIPKMIFDRKGPLVIKPAYFLKFLPWSLRFLWASRPTSYQRGIQATKSLNDLALASWKQLLCELELNALIQCNGSLEIFQTAKAFRKAPSLVAQFRRQGIKAEIMSADEVRRRLPALTGKVAGAIFFSDTGHCLNPYRLVTEIFDNAMNRGVNFIEDNILKVIQQKKSRLNLVGHKQTYITNQLVIAAGFASGKIIKSLGMNAPVEAERGYHYMLPRPNIDVGLSISFHERKFILTPMEHGIRLAGTVEFAGSDAPPTKNRARMLFDFARESFPELKEYNGEEWMGCRPTMPDFLPVIDQRENITFAFGHNHLGLTQAAITAQLVDELIQRHAPSINLKPFRLNRF